MSPAVRRLTIAAAIGAALLLAVVLALPSIVSLDAMRARILGAAEAALHRKVEAGAIRLEILTGLGVGIERITVSNGPGWETPALASADRLSVKLAFWPLLSRRIEVRKIVLEGATLTVERDPKGALNIGDLGAPSEAGGGQTSPSGVAALLVSRLAISRGRLLFADRKVAPGRTVTTSIDGLTGQIIDVGPATAARFALSARFLADAGRNLTIEGSLGPSIPGKGLGAAPFQSTLRAKGLVLTRLQPYLGTPGGRDPGVLSIDGTVRGAFRGVLEIAGDFALAPAASSTFPPVEGKLALSLDGPGGAILVAKSSLSVAKLPLIAEGRIDGLHAAPRVAFRLTTPGDVGLDSVTGLPGLSGRLPSDLKLSGRVRLNATVEGPFSDLVMRAAADAARFSASRGGEALFTAPALRATLSLRGKQPLTGRISAPSGALRRFPFEDLVADWSWDEGSLSLTPSLRAFGGSVRGRFETDTSHPKSESRLGLDVQGLQAQPLLETLTSIRNVLAGVLTAKMSITTRGLSCEAFSKTARGEGRLSLANADLRTVELMPQVLSTLTAIGRVAGFQVPASLASTRFTTLDTGLRLADGRLATPGLTLSGRDITATADGSIGLDRSLAYEGLVTLGPALVKSLGNAGRYLADEQGRLSLPFHAAGPISGPKVSIDNAVVLDLGRRVLAHQARDRIQGGAGKILGDALESGGGKSSDPIDLLQQFLRPPLTPTPAH